MFKDKVVYQIYIKSFNDSNSDGIGDLNGIIEKLDYLKTLGIDYIWITPFFVSPLKDNGYDIKDYYQIDKTFGTMGDFYRLIALAKEKGIGIILDMVLNHTSTEHIWFQKAINGDKKYQNYYIWREKPTNWQSKFGGSAWEYVKSVGAYYLHLFDKTQADLNWENPEVREEMKKIVSFWKNKGVAGFRFDVINLISKPVVFENDQQGDGRRFYTDGKNVHSYIQELVRDTGIADIFTVAELSSTSIDESIKYSTYQNREFSMFFNFHHLKVDYKNNNKWEIESFSVQKLKNIMQTWQTNIQQHNAHMSLFFNNHDQPRSVSRFGNDTNYHAQSAKMLATFTHLLNGIPYIYQGEEIGMTNNDYQHISDYNDVESLNYYNEMQEKGVANNDILAVLSQRSRDNGRSPMQWDNKPFAAFSKVKPWLAVNKNYPKINVVNQLTDENSIFHHYRKLIALRKKEPCIQHGVIEFLDTNENIIAYKRTDQNTTIIVINNFTVNTINTSEHNQWIAKGANILLSNYTDIATVLRPYESLVLKLPNSNPLSIQ